MNHLLSVVIPVYNASNYLDQCVQSVLAQTYKNFEIWLINDGSTDNSPYKCDVWAKKDPRIHVIHKENGGPASVRNLGLETSESKYICFLDSDDYIASTMFEKAMWAFDRYDADIVECNCAKVSMSGEFICLTEKITDGLMNFTDALKELVLGNINNYIPNKIFKRTVFEGVCFPEGFFWEDMGTAYKLFLNAEKIYCISDAMYFYRRNPKGIVGTMSGKALRDIFLMRRQRYTDLLEIYPDIAELDLPALALSARRFYDRSLWEPTDEVVLAEALVFLSSNKQKILQAAPYRSYQLFYKFPWLYKSLRIFKHKMGNLVKKVKKI